jgi:hypothetical protein
MDDAVRGCTSQPLIFFFYLSSLLSLSRAHTHMEKLHTHTHTHTLAKEEEEHRGFALEHSSLVSTYATFCILSAGPSSFH